MHTAITMRNFSSLSKCLLEERNCLSTEAVSSPPHPMHGAEAGRQGVLQSCLCCPNPCELQPSRSGVGVHAPGLLPTFPGELHMVT